LRKTDEKIKEKKKVEKKDNKFIKINIDKEKIIFLKLFFDFLFKDFSEKISCKNNRKNIEEKKKGKK
jgi:hypothetical protein